MENLFLSYLAPNANPNDRELSIQNMNGHSILLKDELSKYSEYEVKSISVTPNINNQNRSIMVWLQK